MMKVFTILAVVIGLSGSVAEAQTATVDKVLSKQEQTGKNEAKSQVTIDRAAKETDALLSEYRVTLQKIEHTRIYNDQVEQLIASQVEEIDSVETQIGQVEKTNKEVVPLMIKMIDRLDELVKADRPFLVQERTERIKGLREMLTRADVSTSEKYRRILEAYQIENEYGRTIEAYRDNLDIEGKSFAVDFLRMGRISLVYQTLDGAKSGFWDADKKTWSDLDSSYGKKIRDGLRVARKQTAPELVEVPVSAPEEVK